MIQRRQSRNKHFDAFRVGLGLLAISTVGVMSCNRHSHANSRALKDRAPAFASSPEILRAQIQNDVMSAIDKNRSSATYRDYGTSGFSASDVFSNIRALRDRNAWTALCQTLGTLDSESLALFEEEIRNPKTTSFMPCASNLGTRLTKFWQDSRIRLKQHVAKIDRKPRANRSLSTISGVVEKSVSVSEAPIFTREGLNENEVALIFTDGPNPTYTIRILDILKATGVRATFFHIGQLIRARPEIDHRLVDERHTLGTHGFSHHDLSRIDLKSAERIIEKGREEAEAASGVDAPFYRPAYGRLNNDIRAILKRRKMPVFMTNIDSGDWKTRNVNTLYDRVLEFVEKEKGGSILFHETQEQTVIVLRALIDELKARGYHFVVFVPGN
jgi:peptidoglycan/xylan/chitin deacetylase (PgdA/CDA1 family)